MSMTPIIDHTRIVFTGTFFCIADVSASLPRHPSWPHGFMGPDPTTGQPYSKGTYRAIPGRKIDRVVYHQTEGGYAPAWTQLQETAQFFVRDPRWKGDPPRWTGQGRGWPGFAYGLLVPFSPIVFEDRWVVFQCNSLDLVTWHTGDGCNEPGIGVAFQGYFAFEPVQHFRPLKGQDGHPSDAQLQIAEDLWFEYFKPTFKLSNKRLETHSMHKKPSCPGVDLDNLAARIRALDD